MSILENFLDLALILIQKLSPSELEKIKKEISKLEKQHEENKQKFIKAVIDGDIDSINQLYFLPEA